MTIYVEIIDNTPARSTNNIKIAEQYEFQNVITTEYQDYSIYNNKYAYDIDNNVIILNPDYEAEEQEKAHQAHILELKEQLKVIDEKSSRSLRAIIAGTATDEDRQFLASLEAQAEQIRSELND